VSEARLAAPITSASECIPGHTAAETAPAYLRESAARTPRKMCRPASVEYARARTASESRRRSRTRTSAYAKVSIGSRASRTFAALTSTSRAPSARAAGPLTRRYETAASELGYRRAKCGIVAALRSSRRQNCSSVTRASLCSSWIEGSRRRMQPLSLAR
jgi:hypothetical protein